MNALEKMLPQLEDTLAPRLKEAKRQEANLRRMVTEVRKKISNLVDALADGISVPEVKDRLQKLKLEEADLVHEMATCQIEAEQSVKLDVTLVRQHVVSTLDLLREATPEEFKAVLKDLFRIEINLDTQEGQLYFKLAPDASPEARFSYGRSARI